MIAFLIVGVVVYQVTAPASPGERGLLASLSRLADHVRREVRGNRARAEHTVVSAHPVDDSVTELRITEFVRGEVHVTGEPRSDVEAALHVVSNAADDTEAQETAAATALHTERAAGSLLMRIGFPGPGRQRVTLRLRVPARFHVRVESRPDTLAIADVRSVEVTNAGGTTTVRGIPEAVLLTQQSGAATLEQLGTLRFTGRRTRLAVHGVRGEAEIDVEQGGSATASRLGGRVEVRARGSEVTLKDLPPDAGPVRIDAHGGWVAVEGLRSDARIDSRNARVDVTLAAPAPLAIYTHGGRTAVTLPERAYTLDVVASHGRITPDDIASLLGVPTESTPEEHRLQGAVGGGGPAITIRATQGDVLLRKPE